MLRTSIRAGVIAGLFATIALTGVLALAAALLQLSFAPYDLADIIIRLTPGAVATEGIETLGVLAKIIVKLVAVGAFIGFGGVLGGLVGWAVQRWGTAVLLPMRNASGLVLLLVLLGLALVNYQATRPHPLQPVSILVLGGLALAWCFGVGYLFQHFAVDSTDGAMASLDIAPTNERRAFLIKSGATVLTIAFGSSALAELLQSSPESTVQNRTLPEPSLRSTEAPVDVTSFNVPTGVRERVTPQSDLYYVSSRIRDPRIDAQSYTLTIEGNVERPLSFTLEQLLNLPRVDQTSTLECISNEVGGNLIGNCAWNGTRLADLLAQAVVRPDSQRVVLHGADGYVDSIALTDALAPTTLVVFGIDNESLTVPHGYPVRLIVPNIYGMKNVKWLQKIEVVSFDFQGYWQERGWSQPAVVKITSVTDTAGTLSLENGVVPLGGIAFAGSRGIQNVEVQIDNGPWQPAELEPAATPLQWRRWRWDWPAAPGRHLVAVRAVDGTGELQSERVTEPHPDGASGYHVVSVTVRG